MEDKKRKSDHQNLWLTDFWISFNWKLHNHFLGISADENKWRIRFLTHVWILQNAQNKKFRLVGTNFEFKENQRMSQISPQHSDDSTLHFTVRKKDYAQQARTNLCLSPGLSTVFLYSVLPTISCNGNNWKKECLRS